MAEEQENAIEQQENSTTDSPLQEEAKISEKVEEKFKQAGQTRISYAEYMARREKKEKKSGPKVPTAVKLILKIPVFALLLLGLCFIPYMLYIIISGTYKPPVEHDKTKVTIFRNTQPGEK